MNVDLAALWRDMATRPTDRPRVGALVQAGEPQIMIDVTQECLIALPEGHDRVPEVSVTISSLRPGIAGAVVIAANFNSADGNYQGPTAKVGEGTFTATNGQVDTRFVVLRSGFPLLGVGAVADFEDGVHAATLTYVQIACDPWVWWRWLAPFAGVLMSRLSPARAIPTRRRGGGQTS